MKKGKERISVRVVDRPRLRWCAIEQSTRGYSLALATTLLDDNKDDPKDCAAQQSIDEDVVIEEDSKEGQMLDLNRKDVLNSRESCEIFKGERHELIDCNAPDIDHQDVGQQCVHVCFVLSVKSGPDLLQGVELEKEQSYADLQVALHGHPHYVQGTDCVQQDGQDTRCPSIQCHQY